MTKSQILIYELIKSRDEIDDKTKLAKLEYFCDFIHYAFNNEPISQKDIIYTKQKQGLLARSLTNDLLALKSSGLIEESPRYHYRIKKNATVNLSAKEKKTVNYVIEKYGNLSYDELVDICHSQVPYLATKDGAVAEFFTAYNLVDEYPDYGTRS